MATPNTNAVLDRKSAGGPSANAWTTPDQTEWLNSQRGAYKTAQAQRGSEPKTAFWAMVFEHWRETWPFPELTPEEKAAGETEESRLKGLKERIKRWFNNHTRASASAGGRRKLLKLGGTKRKLRDTQAYQKLYYSEKIKPVVQAKWEVAWKSKPEYNSEREIPPPPLRFRNEITNELWQAESDEVKARVNAYKDGNEQDDVLFDDEAEDDVDDEELKRRAKAKLKQANIDAIPNTVLTLLEQLYNETGLIGCVALAGPEPMQGGNIFVQSFFHGKTLTGFDFDTTYPTVVKDLEAALTDFATAAIPYNVRISSALPGTESLAVPHVKKYFGPSSLKPLQAAPPTVSRSATPSVPLQQAGHRNLGNTTGSESAENTFAKAAKGKGRRDVTPEVTPSPTSGSDIGSSPSEPEDDGNGESLVEIGGGSEYERTREANITRNKQAVLALASDWNMFHEELAQQKAAAEGEKGKKKKKKSGKGVEAEDNGSTGVSGPRRSERNMATTSDNPSAASAPPAVVMDRTGWPKWLSTAVDNLIASTSNISDPNLRDLIARLPVLDAKLGFVTGTNKACKIDATGRPAVIAKWINAGRKLEAQPVVTNISAYSREWWKWWGNLQPKSRKSGELLREVCVGETWEECRKGGKNGFYMIVLSLSWWAQAASTSEARADVSKATEDALWVLDRMIESLTVSRKHALDDHITSGHSKRLKTD